MKRKIYLVRPPVVSEVEPEVLASYAVYDHLELAAELWRLANQPERASEIEGTVSRAYDHEVTQLTTVEIERLLASLVGLDEATHGALTNERHEIPTEQLPALRARTELLDIAEFCGNDAVFAVQEALINVHNLRSALRLAREQGVHIVFD